MSSILLQASNNQTGGLTHDEATSLDYLLVCVCIAIVLLTAHASHLLHWSWLSETGAIIVLGLVTGGLFRLFDLAEGNSLHHFSFISTVKFQHDIFLNVILPLIILEAGYSLKHSGIVRNLGAVLLLAVPGTLISTLIIGGIVYGWSGWSLEGLYEAPGGLMLCFTFGSLLSATDPVSVIALLSSQFDLSREPPLLYNLIFGESVLNDAVAIVLFDVFIAYIKEPLNGASVIMAILTFAKIFILSSLIGYVVGLMCAFLFRFVNFHDVHHIEVSLMGLFCAASYYLCDFIDLSGIMGLFICSRTCGHLATYNMSRTARETAPFVFKTLAAISECAVFFLLGTAIWAYDGVYNASMIVGVIVACLISRFFVVIPFCGLSNLKRNIEVITAKMQLFMWYSGLRGAIAFGLVVILHDKSESGELGGGIPANVTSILLTATLCTILFTVLLMGAGAPSLLKYLELHKPVDDEVLQSRLKAQELARQLEQPLPELRGLGWLLRTLEKRFIDDIIKRKPPTAEELALLEKENPSRYASIVGGGRKSGKKSRKMSRRVGHLSGDQYNNNNNNMITSQPNLSGANLSSPNLADGNNGGYGAVSGVSNMANGGEAGGADEKDDDDDETSARFFMTRRTHNEWGSTAAKPIYRASTATLNDSRAYNRFGSSIQPIVSGGGGVRRSVTFNEPANNNTSSNDKPMRESTAGNSSTSPSAPGSPIMSTGNLASSQQPQQQQQQNPHYLGVSSSSQGIRNRSSSSAARHSHHHHASSGWQDAVRESRRAASMALQQQQNQQSNNQNTSLLPSSSSQQQQQQQRQQYNYMEGDDDDYSGSGSSSSDEEFYEYNPQKRPYEFSRMF